MAFQVPESKDPGISDICSPFNRVSLDFPRNGASPKTAESKEAVGKFGKP